MAHPVDAHVGKRIRHRRWMLGLSQSQLADKISCRFQQIQKYEAGSNRVSASRLWEISDALDVSIGYFFDGLEEKQDEADPSGDPLSDKEAAALVRFYYAMPIDQRKQIFELARVLGLAA